MTEMQRSPQPKRDPLTGQSDPFSIPSGLDSRPEDTLAERRSHIGGATEVNLLPESAQVKKKTRKKPTKQKQHTEALRASVNALKNVLRGTFSNLDVETARRDYESRQLEFSGRFAVLRVGEQEEIVHVREVACCQYVADAAKAMFLLLDHGPSVRKSDLIKIADIGRATLERLNGDKEFWEIAGLASKWATQDRLDYCHRLTRDVEAFSRFFLSNEWEQLLLSGMSGGMARTVVSEMERMRLELNPHFAQESIRLDRNIEAAMSTLSLALDALRSGELSAAKQEKILGGLKKLVFGLVGVSIIVLDTTVGTIQMTTPYSVLSAKIGEKFLEEAVKELAKAQRGLQST